MPLVRVLFKTNTSSWTNMIVKTAISISPWLHLYMSASVMRTFYPIEASTEDEYNPTEKLIIFSLLCILLLDYLTEPYKDLLWCII